MGATVGVACIATAGVACVMQPFRTPLPATVNSTDPLRNPRREKRASAEATVLLTFFSSMAYLRLKKQLFLEIPTISCRIVMMRLNPDLPLGPNAGNAGFQGMFQDGILIRSTPVLRVPGNLPGASALDSVVVCHLRSADHE
jgi:hypothetical protein